MSNIGFMQHFAQSVEKLFSDCVDNPKKNPTSLEKEDYISTIRHLETMYNHNEIEDVKLYHILMRKIKENDITKIADFRKRLRKNAGYKIWHGSHQI